MAVSCPAVAWPRSLAERGPVEDPTILLVGEARIGDATVSVVAIRIRPELRRTPDYRADVPRDAYAGGALETVLDELEGLTEEIGILTGAADRSIVRLPTGAYLVWILPATQSDLRMPMP